MTIDYEKYYTKPSIAKDCCNIIKKRLNIHYHDDLIIEPSAGNGSFMQPIKRMCKNAIFFDIEPEVDGCLKADYLNLPMVDISAYHKIHVIGNPPFGFKASKAIKFIKKSCKFCDTISFILPRSFDKKSMQNTVPLDFHLIHSHILPDYSFIKGNHDHNIPCVFQLWVKMRYDRLKYIKTLPLSDKYKYVKDPKEADVAIRRVGHKAGSVFTSDLHTKNTNSHYFISVFNNEDIRKIKKINCKSKESVTGPLSISKYEMTKYLNKILS